MTAYQHPPGVQLINCDCEHCRAAAEAVRVVYANRFEITNRRPETYYRAIYASDGSPQVVPNRLYGAEINHEGEAI
jgi:hypothetical protein